MVVPSVLWHCWLGGRKGIQPVKNWVVRCWRGYLSGARCRLAQAQLMPLPLTVSCFSKIQIGFTFLVPAHPGSPGKRAVKRVCVCVCVSVRDCDCDWLHGCHGLHDQSKVIYSVLSHLVNGLLVVASTCSFNLVPKGRTAFYELGQGQLYTEPHRRPISCRITSLPWQELVEEMNNFFWQRSLIEIKTSR